MTMTKSTTMVAASDNMDDGTHSLSSLSIMTKMKKMTASSYPVSVSSSASLCRCVVIVIVVLVVAGPHSLCCCHRPCLRHCSSLCCCRHRRRCRPRSMVGCCIAHSIVCGPICHLPLSSSCKCQHFCRRPQSPITNLCHPLSCHSCPCRPSPPPLPSMVGCCVLPPPSSIPTEPPSLKGFQFLLSLT